MKRLLRVKASSQNDRDQDDETGRTIRAALGEVLNISRELYPGMSRLLPN
jgi:hypothetical protein